jgi:hypothetical protein
MDIWGVLQGILEYFEGYFGVIFFSGGGFQRISGGILGDLGCILGVFWRAFGKEGVFWEFNGFFEEGRPSSTHFGTYREYNPNIFCTLLVYISDEIHIY